MPAICKLEIYNDDGELRAASTCVETDCNYAPCFVKYFRSQSQAVIDQSSCLYQAMQILL